MEVKNCLICNSEKHKVFLQAKDFTVSRETFTIKECEECGFKFTSPRPPDSEIGKYYKSESYISHTNTNKGLISKLYKMVRNKTLKEKRVLIEQYASKGNHLDYGCGTGMFAKVCKDNGWNTFGIEPDDDARKFATENNGVTAFSSLDKAQTYITETKFNVITLWHVLEHVSDMTTTLSFFKEKLNDNGALIIAVPNCNSYDAKYYKEFWAAYDVPRHLHHFTEKDMVKLISSYGFKHIQSLPMRFDSYYVSMLSEKYKTGSSGLIKAFLTGWKSNRMAKGANEYSSVIYVFKK